LSELKVDGQKRTDWDNKG